MNPEVRDRLKPDAPWATHLAQDYDVRRYAVDRVERPRTIVRVETPFGEIPVKVSGGPFGPPQRKPEVDACIAAAKAHGVPLRQVIDAAMVASSGGRRKGGATTRSSFDK